MYPCTNEKYIYIYIKPARERARGAFVAPPTSSSTNMFANSKPLKKLSPAKRATTSNWSETYGCEFVASIDEVTCPVCQDVVQDAQVTSCCEGHFCEYCIGRILRSKDSCPLCREPQFEAVPSKKYSLKVQSLEVYCKMKDRGCPWRGALRESAAHLDAVDGSCSYVDVDCPNKCGLRIVRNSLPLHLRVVCSKSESVCPYCRKRSTVGELAGHLGTCYAFPLPCPNLCAAGKLERRRMEHHLRECPLQPVECEFFHAGCAGKISRRDSAKHGIESAHAHLSMLSASMAKRFEQQCEQLRKKDEEIAALRSELRELRLHVAVPPVEFSLADHVEHFKDGKEWFSPDFYTHHGGYLLCLQVTKEVTRDEAGQRSYRLALSAKVKEGPQNSAVVWPRKVTVGIQVIARGNTVSRVVALSLSPKSVLPLLQFDPNKEPAGVTMMDKLSNSLTLCVFKIELI